MKKIIITSLIGIFLVSGLAFGMTDINQNLIDVWNKRLDLQKVFPDPNDANKNDLINWAKKYGWKENDSLINFSPYAEIIDKLLDVKLKTINDRLFALENKPQQVGTIVETVKQIEYVSDNTRMDEFEKKISAMQSEINLIKSKDFDEQGEWVDVCVKGSVLGPNPFTKASGYIKYSETNGGKCMSEEIKMQIFIKK